MMQIPQLKNYKGVTLMEMTIVLMIIIALLSIGVYFGFGFGDWLRGKKASETLKQVYTAQRTWLADHPLKKPVDITEEQILNYMKLSTLPVVEGNKGEELSIDFNVSPPILKVGGDPYDPSPETNDGIWDTGAK